MKKMVLLLIMIGLLSSGCGVTYARYPEKLADVKDVFTDKNETVPRESHLKADYEAPYDDVFEATKRALPMADVNPELSNKEKGYILGVRSDIRKLPSNNIETRYFIRVLFKEIGAEKTSVDVQTKIQSECFTSRNGPGVAIMTLGITAAIDKSFGVEERNQNCVQYLSKPNWAIGERKESQTPQKVHRMISINLMKAGLM